MRRILQLSVLGLAAGVVTACLPEEVVETEHIPTAGVRFVHAVPDTGSMDFRFVDLVENSAHYNFGFRATANLYYKPARAGQRQFRIFMNSLTDQTVASTVVKDSTVTLEEGKLYTFLLWGYARPGSSPPMRLSVIEDAPADPGSQVALRVINAAAGRGALDVSYYPASGQAPATPTWPAVSELSASTYVLTAAGQIRYNAKPVGGAATPFADATALQGQAATVDLEAIPGTTIPGSAVTGILVPGSVLGSQAAAAVSTTGAASLSATATGYARASGSFVTNGFRVGDTVTVSGFTNPQNNGQAVVTAVAATSLTVSRALAVEAAAAGRTVVTPRPAMIFVWDRRPPR
jgi:hypothetical protein